MPARINLKVAIVVNIMMTQLTLAKKAKTYALEDITSINQLIHV